MGVYLKESVKSIVLSAVGIGLGVAVTLFTLKVFNKPENGFQQNLNKYSQFLSYIGMFGVGNTLLTFGQKYNAKNRLRPHFLGNSLLISSTVTLIIFLLYFIFYRWFTAGYKNYNDQEMVIKFFICFPLYTLLNTVLFWMDSYLQSVQKNAAATLAREIMLRILNIILIAAFALSYISFSLYIYGYVLSILIPIGFEIYIARRQPGFQFSFQISSIPREERKGLFTFSFYHALSSVSTILIYQIDGLLIPLLAVQGFDGLAQYALASYFCNMLRTPTRMVGTTITPAFAKAYLDDNREELSKIYHKSALNLQLISISLLLLMLINLDDMMKVMQMLHPGYDSVKKIVPILLFGQMFEMMGGPNYELIGVTRYYRFNFWIANILVVLVTVFMILLIPKFGLYGAAWGFSSGMIIFSLLKLYIAYVKLGLQPFQKALIKIVLISVSLAGAVYFLLPAARNPLLNAVYRTGIYSFVLWGILYKTHVSAELDQLTRQILHKVKLRRH